MSTIRILLVEDHPIYRDGLRTGLAASADIEVVGECGDAGTARALVADLRPDVVLMDLDLGPESGIELTRELTAEHEGLAVLVLTMNDSDAALVECLRAGARGYLMKGVDLAELTGAICQVAAGGAVLGPGAARKILNGFAAPRDNAAREDRHLTSREREILELMAQGWGNPQIAETLFLSPKTVRNNVSVILGKLHATSRGDAVVRARGWGYGDASPTT
jgi:DNA-binding NarL/FixJ family response regulator